MVCTRCYAPLATGGTKRDVCPDCVRRQGREFDPRELPVPPGIALEVVGGGRGPVVPGYRDADRPMGEAEPVSTSDLLHIEFAQDHGFDRHAMCAIAAVLVLLSLVLLFSMHYRAWNLAVMAVLLWGTFVVVRMALRMLLNRTHIVATRAGLLVEERPLPMGAPIHVAKEGIVQVHVQSSVTLEDELDEDGRAIIREVAWLVCEDRLGSKQKLCELDTLGQAHFVELHIKRFYGIRDPKVEGERII